VGFLRFVALKREGTLGWNEMKKLIVGPLFPVVVLVTLLVFKGANGADVSPGGNSTDEGAVTMIFWGAYDVQVSLDWQHHYEEKIMKELQEKGVVFLDACKDFFGERWREEHSKGNTLLKSLIANGQVPYRFPHFTYLKHGKVVMETSGFAFATWYKQHSSIIDRLLGELSDEG